MPKLCLWDVEPRSYHNPSASQVGALPQKTALIRHFMSARYPPERQREMGRPQLCVFQSVITVAALESCGYTVALPFQICICFTLGLRTWPVFIYCPLVHDTAVPLN